METPLLQTKLYVPPIRPELVSRPRLIEQLHEGPRSGRKLTLISAPAGFGKTTLIAEWGTEFAETLRSRQISQSGNYDKCGKRRSGKRSFLCITNQYSV